MWLPRALNNVRTLKTLLNTAESIARADGQELPGTEHLVLSALALPDATAERALQQIGISTGDLTSAVEAVHRAALDGIGLTHEPAAVPSAGAPKGLYRMTPPAQQVFQDAVALSKTAAPKLLLGGHVLVAAARQEHGTWARAVKRLGIDRDRLAAAAQAELSAYRPG
ncbi:Clp protease N-terminal domain-containing protein [Catellatospora sichuanensis]|uniref:Clp protease N-terminal domain-containing protein n=1 Tax=Catellatospora sichuanensis TaxID=1969805 RepID=UPI0011834EBD|nr:Clp protease N-terminal domain-containing protein [Catellatospora sichuanensis]